MDILTHWTSEALYTAWSAGVSHFFWYSLRDGRTNPAWPTETRSSRASTSAATTSSRTSRRKCSTPSASPSSPSPGAKASSSGGGRPKAPPGKVAIQIFEGKQMAQRRHHPRQQGRDVHRHRADRLREGQEGLWRGRCTGARTRLSFSMKPDPGLPPPALRLSARPAAPRPRLSTMKIGIVGLGYVGLPLAVAFAEAGHEVVGLDTDARKVEALNEGRSYVEDIPDASPGAARATASARPPDHAELASCEAVIVCVPTPLTGSREPDLTYLTDSADGARRASCSRTSWSCWSRPPTRGRRASACSRSSSRGRGCRPAATSTSPSRPSGSTRAAPTTPCGPRRSWSAASRRPAPSGPASCTSWSATRSSSSRPRRRRSWRSCSRTSSARSTSPWSTSSPSSATGSGSTSGR